MLQYKDINFQHHEIKGRIQKMEREKQFIIWAQAPWVVIRYAEPTNVVVLWFIYEVQVLPSSSAANYA